MPRLPRLAVARRRPRARRPAAHRPGPDARASRSRWSRRRRREVRALFDELGVLGLPKTTGNRGIHVFAQPPAAMDLLRGARRSGSGGPRARAPPPRPHHCGMVEGGARHAGSSSTSTRTHRTRRSSVRGRSGLARGAGVDAVRLGRAGQHRPRRAHRGHRPCPGAPRRATHGR